MPEVVGETKHFYGIYKPACWNVCVCEGKYTKESNIKLPQNYGKLLLQNWLTKNLDYELKDKILMQYGIANRLDKETSGIIIVAKDAKSYKFIRKEMTSKFIDLTEKRTRKYYITLVRGIVKPQKGTITDKINCKKVNNSNYCFIDNVKGKRSHTEYQTLKHYEDPDTKQKYTLLKVRIKTGLTHQIRIHMKSIGHVVASDPLYSDDFKCFQQDFKKIPRLFLHSMQYSFVDPDGKCVTFKKMISRDLCESLLKLKEIKHVKVTNKELEKIISTKK